MNLHALRVFHSVAVHGSVTCAAEELLISQPAVTAQIRKLEKELGIVLLAPRGRGIFLTEAGHMLAGHARRLFSLEREIDAAIADFIAGKAGTLRIAATYLPANFLLPKWVARYKQQNPGIEISLTTTNGRNALDKLLHYEADLAVIGGGSEQHAGVIAEVLAEDEFWFIVPNNHPLAGEEVALAAIMREPFILREEGSSARERLIALCRIHNLQPPIVGLQFNGLNETIRAVMAGYGANFVSALEVREYVERGEVARVFVRDIHVKNPITLYVRGDDRLTPGAEGFVCMLKQASSLYDG